MSIYLHLVVRPSISYAVCLGVLIARLRLYLLILLSADALSRDATARCIATFKRPYAIPVDKDGNIEAYQPISTNTADQLYRILSPVEILNIDPTLITIIEIVATYVPDVNLWLEKQICPNGDPIYLQRHACILMYRLFDWYDNHTPSSSNPYATGHPIDRCICLALLIFIVSVSDPDLGQDGQTSGPSLIKTVHKLKDALLHIPPQRWAGGDKILVWVLTMGAVGARRLPPPTSEDLIFFKQYGRQALQLPDDFGLYTREYLYLTTMTWLWVPMIFEDRVQRICAELCQPEGVDVTNELIGGIVGSSLEDDEIALGESTGMRFFKNKT